MIWTPRPVQRNRNRLSSVISLGPKYLSAFPAPGLPKSLSSRSHESDLRYAPEVRHVQSTMGVLSSAEAGVRRRLPWLRVLCPFLIQASPVVAWVRPLGPICRDEGPCHLFYHMAWRMASTQFEERTKP